jgi:hypothetical protein
MSANRRQFLQTSSIASIASALAIPELNALAQTQNSTKGNAQGVFDQSVFNFWTSRVRSPYEDFLAGVNTRGGEQPQPRDSTFVFPSKKGLVPASTLSPDDIDGFPADGNKDISVHVERFRPSPADKAALANLQTGTLRIDVKQVTPMLGLPEALAWTAMATLASRQHNQPVPSLDTVKFDPGTVWGQFQSIPLTDGLGFWSWNFFMKRREGFWGQLLDHLFKTLDIVQPLLPLLGLPGIAVSGLKYVDQIVGAIQAQGQSQWLFKGLDIAVCATKQSFMSAGANGARKLPLTTGSYVILPEDSVGQLDKNLVVQDGLLVPANTDPIKIYDVARTIIPSVSYMTISVSVSDSKTKSTDQTQPANQQKPQPQAKPTDQKKPNGKSQKNMK